MDQCLVDGSPWLFAVTHVLHRFLAPRHPPLALCSLEEQRCSCSLCNSQGAPRRTTTTEPGSGSTSRQLPHNGREDSALPAATVLGSRNSTVHAVDDEPPVHQRGSASNHRRPRGRQLEEQLLRK